MKRCGHTCPEVCHADMDDSHTTGIKIDPVTLLVFLGTYLHTG